MVLLVYNVAIPHETVGELLKACRGNQQGCCFYELSE